MAAPHLCARCPPSQRPFPSFCALYNGPHNIFLLSLRHGSCSIGALTQAVFLGPVRPLIYSVLIESRKPIENMTRIR